MTIFNEINYFPLNVLLVRFQHDRPDRDGPFRVTIRLLLDNIFIGTEGPRNHAERGLLQFERLAEEHQRSGRRYYFLHGPCGLDKITEVLWFHMSHNSRKRAVRSLSKKLFCIFLLSHKMLLTFLFNENDETLIVCFCWVYL